MTGRGRASLSASKVRHRARTGLFLSYAPPLVGRSPQSSRLGSSEKLPVATADHLLGGADEALDTGSEIAGLPVGANAFFAEEGRRDLALAGAGAHAIVGLQHHAPATRFTFRGK